MAPAIVIWDRNRRKHYGLRADGSLMELAQFGPSRSQESALRWETDYVTAFLADMKESENLHQPCSSRVCEGGDEEPCTLCLYNRLFITTFKPDVFLHRICVTWEEIAFFKLISNKFLKDEITVQRCNYRDTTSDLSEACTSSSKPSKTHFRPSPLNQESRTCPSAATSAAYGTDERDSPAIFSYSAEVATSINFFAEIFGRRPTSKPSDNDTPPGTSAESLPGDAPAQTDGEENDESSKHRPSVQCLEEGQPANKLVTIRRPEPEATSFGEVYDEGTTSFAESPQQYQKSGIKRELSPCAASSSRRPRSESPEL
ncbi:hypothetical protein BV898_10169 [Hypsibius exemplaris]|uniref:Uncharacterized protein n=1 Tax=Hypsibius exemplaris TaxID=2072580 RepID=A0A1W0WKG0_HYPEX|nr:hypothetical protein BV898_10169 [Hypsibius exemplaris]